MSARQAGWDGRSAGIDRPIPPGPGFAARTVRRLCRALARPVPVRALWQRVLYPLAGCLLLVVAVVGALLPVLPGFLFAIPGVWLLCCSRPGWERRARRCLRGLLIRWLRRSRRRS